MREWTMYFGFGLLIFLLTIHKGSGILCWTCRSDYDNKCSDPFDNKTFPITDCSQKTLPHLHFKPSMCRKIRQKVNGQWRFIRGCAWLGEPGIGGDERYCLLRSGTWDIHMEYCTCNQKDGCNDARRVAATNLITVLVSVIASLAAFSIGRHCIS